MHATAVIVFLSALTLATTGHASEPLNPGKGSEIGTATVGIRRLVADHTIELSEKPGPVASSNW